MASKYWWRDDDKETDQQDTSNTTQATNKPGNKYWWRDEENTTSGESGQNQQNSGSKYWWRADDAPTAAENITNRVKTWLENHNNFITNYQTRNSGRKYTYEDSYVSDSADWLNTVTQQKNNFDAEADAILSYMDQYKDYFDTDWMKSVTDILTSARGTQSQILDNYTKDNQWWSTFKDEDTYKTAQRYDSYSKKYEGMSSEDIMNALDTLEDGEEKDWLTFNQYGMYKGDQDYNIAANAGWQAYTALKSAKQAEEDNKSWFEKAIESFALSPADTSLPNAGLINAQAAYQNDTSYREPNDKWSKEERRHFGYLWSTNRDKAYEYAEQVNNSINAKEKYTQMQAIQSAATNSGWGMLGNTLGAIATAPLALGDFLDDLVEYSARGTITQKPGVTPFEYSQAVQSGVANELNGVDENGVAQNVLPDWVPVVGGKGLGDVYSLGVSTANSLMSAYALGGIGTLINFIGQGGAAGVDDALNRGATAEQALLYGTILGAAEGITEMIPAEELLKVGSSATIKNFFLKSLKQGIGEFAEEGTSAIIGEVADRIIMADKSNFNATVEKYMDDGMSKEEAEKKAWGDLVGDVLYDAMGGFVSGFGSATITGGINTVIDNSEGNQNNINAIKQYGDKTDALIQEGLENDVKSDSYKLAQKYQKKIDSGKTLTGAQIRNLLAANQEQITPNDLKKIQKAAEVRLTTLGQTKDVSKVAELATKWATGQKLSKAEKTFLTTSEYGSRVANELHPKNILEGNFSTAWAEQIGTKQVNATAYNIKSIIEAMTSTYESTTYKPLEERVEGKYSISGNGTVTVDGEDVDLSKATVANVDKDGMTLRVDGEEVSIDDIKFEDRNQGFLYYAVSKIENITPGAATEFIRAYNPSSGLKVGEYLNGIDEAYTYGYHGYSEADLKAGQFTGKLSEKLVKDAYRMGKSVRTQSIQDSESSRVKMRTAAETQSKKEKTAKQKARFKGEAEVYFMDGKTVTKFDESSKYDEKRMAGVNYAKLLSKLGIGSKYYFYESYVENGVRVYKDENGKVVKAPNGKYMTGDGSIYIDLNAGDQGQGTTLFTLGHELTHFIKQWSEAKFKVLADFLIEEYEKTDMSMHERVLAKQKELSGIRGEQVSYNEAFEEVVADAMSTMLADGNLHEKLAKLKAKDNKLFAKIKEFFSNLIAKFREVYATLDPEQKDARDVRAMKDSFDKIQQAFAEALVEASENFQAAGTQKNTTEDGGVKMQTRSVDGNEVVWIEENILKENNGLPVHQFIANYIAEHIGEVYTIIESGQNVYIGEDLPGEYTQSKYTQAILRNSPSISRAKNRASASLGEMIEIATNRRWEKTEHSSNKDAKYGMYRYDTSFGFPVKNANGDVIGANIYEAELLIRNASDGKKYLYDIVRIKKNTAASNWLTQKVASATGKPAGQKSDVSDNKISQPDAEVNSESAEALDIEVDTKTESVSPAVLKSERTWTSSEYVQERDKAAKEIANAIGVSVKKARDYIDSVNSIAKMIAEDRSRLDYFSSPGRSSFVSNAEYGGSFDFSTLCKKRRLLTGTFTAIQKALPNTALTANEILDIRNRMKEKGLEVSCGLCYVEGSRANMGQFAKEFLRLYKQYYPDAWQPNMADVNTPDGIEWVRINHPECYDQYEYFWNHYGTLKEGDKNLFASQQKPKLYQLHTEYKGEILKEFKNDDKVEDKNTNGGIRLQSFSDFEIVHLIDTMQIIMDMSRVGLAGQAYTKVPDFAWALGDTGLKINLSLIAKGVDENGKLIFDDVEGMPIADAMKLRDRYSKNVGTILVAFNDEQLLAAMADDRVDFIIPFHRSQWKKSQYEAMGLPAKTKDYTFMQNEKFIKPTFHEYRGRMVKDKATNYMPNEYWDFSKTGKENAEAYLEMCARNNKRPKFYKFLQNNGDGSYSLKADGSTDGYWKLLIDFKMYDNDGNGSPQMPVKPEFNMDEATRMLNDYSGGHSNFPVAQGIVDGFVKEYKESHNGAKFSERSTANQTNAPTFYSQMGKVVEGMKQDKFGASSVISMLRGRGVKAEEIRWSGIQAFLDGKKSVTKTELLDFIKGSMLQIEEETLAGGEKQELFENFYSRMNDVIPYFSTEEIEEMCFDYDGDFSAENFASALQEYVDDGTISEFDYEEAIEYAEEMGKDLKAGGVKWSKYKLEGGYNYMELLFKMPGSNYTNSSMQNHWDDTTGVLAHARIQNFDTPDGTMLFIEEIQSDWHNAGQKYGYDTGMTETEKDAERVKIREEFMSSDIGKSIIKKVKQQRESDSSQQPFKDDNEVYDWIVIRPLNIGTELMIEYPHWATNERLNALMALDEKISKLNAVLTPDAPFRDNYHEYVLKRLLRMAAEQGYDSIGWTTADIQSQRWSENYAEGYRIEYDQDIPKFLKKYGKQWDATVGKTELDNGTEVWSMAITDSMKESVLKEGQALYQERTSDSVSNRSLLANAFEGIVNGSEEYKQVQRYKKYIAELNSLESKLSDFNRQIREILFTKGKYDAEKLKRLEAERETIAEAINKYDRYLVSLEASAPLRRVIDRERKKAAQKAKEEAKEIQKSQKERYEKKFQEYKDHTKEIKQNRKERAEKTELRHKIRKAIRDLDKLLNRGNKKQNVKEELQPVVTKALQSAEILFTDNYNTYDMLRNGIGTDLSDAEEALVKSCTDMLKDLDAMPTDGYDNWQAYQEAENRLKTKMSKLSEVFARERKRLNNTTVSSILGELADAYAGLEESELSYVQGVYSEPVHNFLKNLQKEVGGTIVKDMTKGQLESVYAAYQMVLTTVRKANQMFNEGLKLNREQLANAVIEEVIQAGGVNLLGTKMGDAIGKFSWNNTKPIWVANRIGSNTFGQLMGGLFQGQYNFAVDIDEVRKFKLSMDEKYRPRSWDAEKLFEFESSTGKKFKLNLQQIMSLYAFSKRDQAYSHLLNGGFVFEENSTVVVDGKLGIKKTYIHKGATSYKLNEATLNGIVNSLTAEQKAYVDEMQAFLSDVMGAKGNEVSMALYGIKMFKEQFYFPLRSSGDYMEKAKEAELKKQQGQINLVNSGFTHSVKPQASNPIILSGFMDVWADHCNEMSMYHSMVLPMEDFRKVYNYSTRHEEGADSYSVHATIKNAYGKEATDYIDQLYRELNAGATVDPIETPYKKLISNFKKAAVLLSGSVWVQQFSSIGRAYAVIDPKYFAGTKVDSGTNLSVAEEMKKYAPVAIIKEMGGFDTGTKGNATSYIKAEQYGKGERLKGLAKDKQYRDDLMGFMPQWADEKTWCAIWEACKRETKAKNPEMDVKSEEFLKLAGDRFSEVIEKTQVYDSVLARSANMRSKSNFMAMATAFMAEPTTTINLLEDAIRSGKAKNIARAFGSVAVSIVLNNALASVVYAMLDDDDDETFIEKYFQAFTSGMIDDINPMSYYPFLKDVWSLFQGYDVERSDMSVIADVRDALKRVVTLLGKDTSNMTDEQLAERYKTVNEAFMGILDAGCSMFGVPLKNVRRDAKGLINAFSTIAEDLSGERKTTWLSFWDKVGAAVKDTIPVYAYTKDESKTDKLYRAIVNGDKAYEDRLKKTYKDESAYNTAVVKALRDNDPRIRAAAQAGVNGDSAERNRIFQEIKKEGKFDSNLIIDAINAETNAIRNQDKPEKVQGQYGAYDFVEAVAAGDSANAQKAREDIIATYEANGKTQAQAESAFESDVRTSIGEAYSYGTITKATAEKMLVDYAGMDEDDASDRVAYWEFQNANPDSDLSESKVLGYLEHAEPAGVSLEIYEQFVEETSGLEDIKNKWGDVEKSKRDQVLEVIDSLPLTWKQKDALYLAAGYAESKIWDVPW